MDRLYKCKSAPIVVDNTAPVFVTDIKVNSHNSAKGEWLDEHEVQGSYSVGKCSKCGEYAQHRNYKGVGQHYRFCPFCGIPMRRNYE